MRPCAGAEVLEAQIATHYIHSKRLGALEERLQGLGAAARDASAVKSALDAFQASAPPCTWAGQEARPRDFMMQAALLLNTVLHCGLADSGVRLGGMPTPVPPTATWFAVLMMQGWICKMVVVLAKPFVCI